MEKFNAATRLNGDLYEKIIALALAVLMLATALVSCNFGAGPGGETTPADTTAGNGEPNDPDATTGGDTTTADPNGDTTTAKPEETKIPAAADDCNLPNISDTSLSIIANSKSGFKIVYAAEMASSAGAYSGGTNIL